MKSILNLTVALCALMHGTVSAADAKSTSDKASSDITAPVKAKKATKKASKKVFKKAKVHHAVAHQHHHVTHHSEVADLKKRLETLEKSAAKSDNGYIQANDTNLGFKLGGNINMFGAYYGKQRPTSLPTFAAAISTNPTYLLTPSTPDTAVGGGTVHKTNSRNRGHFILATDGSTLSSKVLAKTSAGDIAANVDLQLLGNYSGGRATTNVLISDAHVDYNGWVVGYTYSNFADPNSLGNWLNTTGLQESNISTNNYVVQKNFALTNNLKFSLALEAPYTDAMQQTQIDATPGNTGNADRVANIAYGKESEPDITAQLVWNYDRGHISLRFMERKLSVKYYASGKDFSVNKRGYAVGASTKFKYFGESNVYAQYTIGKGVGGYIGELTNYSALWDATLVSGGYRFETLKATSYLLGTELVFNANWRTNVAYQVNIVSYPSWAINETYDFSASPFQLDRRHNKILANVVYKTGNGFEIGLEGGYIMRLTRNDKPAAGADRAQRRGDANFVMLGMKYTF